MAIIADTARALARLGRSGTRAFEAGYRAVTDPYAQPGPEIKIAPFDPGTVSAGAVTAKFLGRLMAGARLESNRRNMLAEAERKRALQDALLHQAQARAGYYERGNQPKADEVVSPVDQSLIDLRGAQTNWWKNRPHTQPRQPGGSPAAQVNAAQKSLDALEAEAKFEAEDVAARNHAPIITALKAAALAGDEESATTLGVDPVVMANYKQKKIRGDSDTVEWLTTFVNKAADTYAIKLREDALARARSSREGKRRALAAAMEKAAGIETEFIEDDETIDADAQDLLDQLNQFDE